MIVKDDERDARLSFRRFAEHKLNNVTERRARRGSQSTL